MRGQLSDGSEYQFDGRYQLLSKHVTFAETLFYITKHNNADRTFTTNAKIGEVYYTVYLNNALDVVQTKVDVAGGEPHEFDVDANLFVGGAAQYANLVDFNHPEIIRALGGIDPATVVDDMN